MTNKFDEDFIEEINLISKKLKNYVSPLEISNWLFNFNNIKEQQDMLYLLSLCNVYTEADIINGYCYCIKNFLEIVKEDDKSFYYIIPNGEIGKSGSAMLYYFKKALKEIINSTPINEEKFKFLSHERNLKWEIKSNRKIFADSNILIIDDFIGSGNSFVNYYYGFINDQIRNFNLSIFILSIAGLNFGINYIKKNIPKSIIFTYNSQPKTFFKCRSKMLRLRNICYNYGIILFKDQPLGFDNSQALITFSYGCPNNTLPIFWSSNKDWFPLFPRFSDDIISKIKKTRKDIAETMSLFKSLGITAFRTGITRAKWRTFNFISKTDFILFSIIRLLKTKRTVPSICSILGISYEDYDNYITEGEKKGLFKSDGSITEYCEKIYRESLTQIRKYKDGLSNNSNNTDTDETFDTYIPKLFRGKH